MINTLKKAALAAALLVAGLASGAANAGMVLDTGTPGASAMPMTLDANDSYAAEFSLGAGQTIDSILAYVTAGSDQPGATFSISIYSASDFGTRNAVQLATGQATYGADGWTGITSMGFTSTTAGLYWVAIEVGASDSATGLNLPSPVSGGTIPALAYAFNSGSGYTTAGAQSFGVQINTLSAVPLPAAVWLLGSGLMGLGAVRRRRGEAAPATV